jgi:hypothetical protein
MDPMAAMGSMGLDPSAMAAPPPAEPPVLEPDQLTMFLGAVDEAIQRDGVDQVRDQLSALPPEILDELYRLIDTDARAAIVLGDVLDPPEREPIYDAWYEAGKKPTATEMMDAAQLDAGTWMEVADRIRDDIDFYHGERPGHFRDFNKKKDDYFLDVTLRADTDAKITKLATAPVKFDVPFTEQELENPTQKAENFLYYLMQCWKAQHAQISGGRDVRHDIEFYRGVTGWVFYECAIDTRGGKPFIHRLYDPTTCVPTWDEYGLARMTRLYSASVADVISAYDDETGSVKRKLLKMTKNNGRSLEPLDYTDTVSVMYYIDRTYRGVFVDGEQLFIATHAYGICPVVVGGSGLSEPTDLTATGSIQVDPMMGAQARRLFYKNTAYFHHLRRAHVQKEAVKTKLFNWARTMDKPRYAIYQDEYAEGEGTPNINVDEGKPIPLKRNHEELVPLDTMIANGFLEPLMGAISAADLTSLMPLAQHGVTQGSQQSGNATEGYIEAGQDKFIIPLQSAEMMWAQIAGLWLRLWRDFGHLIPNEKGQYGRAVVPYSSKARRRHPSQPPAFAITPEMIDHIGTEVEAKLTSLRLQNLGPLGNAGAIWLNNKAMSIREFMELRGVRDPDEIFAEMDYEETLLDEDIRKIKKLQALRKRDPETAMLYEKMIMAKSGPPGGGGGPMDSMAAGGPMAPNTSAVSMPALGMGQDGPTGREPRPDDVINPMAAGQASY